MVWQSFFRGSDDQDRPDVSRVRPYLKRMAEFKITDEARRDQAAKRDSRRDTPLDEQLVRSSEASPSQIAMARETLSNLVRSATPRDQHILQLRLDGETQQTISEKLGVDVRTVRRVMRLMERRSQDSDGIV